MKNCRWHPLLWVFLLLSTACTSPLTSSTNRVSEPPQLYATSVAQATRQASHADERQQIRWFVGLGENPSEKQVQFLQAIAEAYNDSQNAVWLQVVVVPADEAYDFLVEAERSGTLPEIVGPMGLEEGNFFMGEWLDLRPFLSPTFTDEFSEQSLRFYTRGGGQLEGLPITLYPSALFYNKTLFDEAGLAYPPTQYGEPYADGAVWDFDKVQALALRLTRDSNGRSAQNPLFDPRNVVQFGYINQWNEEARDGLVPFGATMLIDETGTAVVPEAWRAGAQWTYEAMWTHRFYPNQNDQFSPLFAQANTFRSGHVAMASAPLWFTCCLGETKFEWDIAPLPSYEGTVTAKTHTDGFRIFRESAEPETAVAVLQWIMTEQYETLLSVYGGIPAKPAYEDEMMRALTSFYPLVANWELFADGLAYADTPHHQAYLPNFAQVEMAETLFWSLLETDPGLDVDAELDHFVSHLQALYDDALPRTDGIVIAPFVEFPLDSRAPAVRELATAVLAPSLNQATLLTKEPDGITAVAVWHNSRTIQLIIENVGDTAVDLPLLLVPHTQFQPAPASAYIPAQTTRSVFIYVKYP